MPVSHDLLLTNLKSYSSFAPRKTTALSVVPPTSFWMASPWVTFFLRFYLTELSLLLKTSSSPFTPLILWDSGAVTSTTSSAYGRALESNSTPSYSLSTFPRLKFSLKNGGSSQPFLNLHGSPSARIIAVSLPPFKSTARAHTLGYPSPSSPSTLVLIKWPPSCP